MINENWLPHIIGVVLFGILVSVSVYFVFDTDYTSVFTWFCNFIINYWVYLIIIASFFIGIVLSVVSEGKILPKVGMWLSITSMGLVMVFVMYGTVKFYEKLERKLLLEQQKIEQTEKTVCNE